MERVLLTVVCGYLLGSVPFSLIVGRLTKGIDLRLHGSGNLGAANTFRTLGVTSGVAVLLLDASKGAASALIGSLLWHHGLGLREVDVMLLGGFTAVCGHIWTVFASLRGGKGVATAAGVFMAVTPLAFAVSLAVWIVVVAVWRYVSLGSMVAAVALPAAVYITIGKETGGWERVFAVSVAVALLVLAKHRANLGRILEGSERRLSIRGG